MQEIQGQNILDLLLKNPPMFEWSDLNGKVLTIKVSEDSGFQVVIGYEQSTDKFYVLHSGNKER